MTTTSSVVTIVLSLAVLCNSQSDESGQCTTPNSVSGACINIKECPELLNILRNQRQQPGAAAFLRKSVCGYDGFDPIVCCPGNNPDQNTPQTVAPTVRPNIGGGILPTPDECGFSNISHTRVVGGVPANLDAWPWMVALGYKPSPRSTSKAPRYLCGASLITNRHVLTAAHCVYGRDDLYFARLGDLDLELNNDDANPINVNIIEKKVHEDYSPKSYTNDIALLTLEKSVPYSASIHPICLPLTPELRSRDFLRVSPFIAGWGAKNFQGPSSSHLQEVQIPVVDLGKCKESFKRFKTAVIDDRVLCAGFEQGGKDACQGDSGGPLMWPVRVTYYQIGVVSYGYRCAEPGIPGVYTRTTAFLDWIIANIK